eukprot:COSAG02_NODE_354_length_24016_cov_208.299231_22_plen_727_part_00
MAWEQHDRTSKFVSPQRLAKLSVGVIKSSLSGLHTKYAGVTRTVQLSDNARVACAAARGENQDDAFDVVSLLTPRQRALISAPARSKTPPATKFRLASFKSLDLEDTYLTGTPTQAVPLRRSRSLDMSRRGTLQPRGATGSVVDSDLQLSKRTAGNIPALAAALSARKHAMVQTDISLEEKLQAVLSTNQQQAYEHHVEGSVASRFTRVGEHLEIFSASGQQWCPGTVIAIAAKEVQIQYHTGGQVDGQNTRTKWVSVNSSDVRRKVNSKDVGLAVDQSSTSDPIDKIELGVKTSRQQLTPHGKEKARRALMRVGSVRTKEMIMELVAWTYSCNAFSGLTLAQRKQVCMEVDGVKTPENGRIVHSGNKSFRADVTIIFDGCGAMYTSRNNNSDSHPKSLATKLKTMKRRNSVVASHSHQRRSAVMPEPRSFEQFSGRLPSVFETGAELARASRHNSTFRSSRNGFFAGNSFLVKVELVDGDVVLPEIAFHNADAERINADGVRVPDLTVLAMEDTTTMVIHNPQHIQWLKRSYEQDIQHKVRDLKRLPKYKNYECIPLLAKHSRRMWYPAGTAIVNESDLAEHVYYLISGKAAIVKQAGKSNEQQLDVIGRGACIGDWGVVNERLRPASCIAQTEVEVLKIRGVNFQAVADDTLLGEITDGDADAGGMFVPKLDTDANANADTETTTDTNETAISEDYTKATFEDTGSFKLISRREIRKAVVAMKK